ncbi:hypothetical protein DH2020_040803 [Rehmannia glutinosa]|uniref:Integrase zinc-binding domain-containing protein n=1 Tax=Rehmannia glutinosa TaxID=99300 RepID=A0ABR0UTP4_REHGL
MYRDLKQNFRWHGMKKDIASYVNKCLTCQQVKVEHQKPAGQLQPFHIPEWKWEEIAMDFIVGMPKMTNGYDAIWVIIDRLTKSAHFFPVKMTFSMDKLVELYVKEIVRLHFKGSWCKYLPLAEFAYNNSYQATIGMAPYEALYGRRCRSPIHWHEAESRQKSYADIRRRPLEFSVGDFVFIKVSPMKGIMRFAMLKKYVPDPSHILTLQLIQIDESFSYEEKPTTILDRGVKKLRNKEIPLVKVLWSNHKVEEAIWEREEDIRAKYPHLF